MRVIRRMLIAAVTVMTAMVAALAGGGTANAGLDDELSLVDGQDRTLTIQQW
ncbi:porin, partial [Mycolicibacterium mageritense]|nr:porin [Mycolicibacterium mageritense]